ncbi:hypothetical protein [Vitiosangium sp. GDMCC 1.1324]|uniref:hypothetical protein n=1 Tax=Vitiosangium sp. (strain GDMCC 1.1324) TaxID=2138576 RepID=UPI001E2A7074|nr:hypothetical protein [Vitiosangium sp. GDMCC 1.1324]
MTTSTFPQKLMASSLSLLLVSCSATRPMVVAQGPTGPHDLAKYALLIQEMPDGQVTHDWKPLKDIDLTKFQYALRAMSSNQGIVRVSETGLEAYCEGRRKQCEQDCLASRRPFRVGHLVYDDVKTTPWREAKWRWCSTSCLEQAVTCNKGRGSWAEEYAAEFNAIEPAVDWIKSHREEILAGTVIVIAGVAFVAAVAASGGGSLLLMPLVFVAELSPGLPAAPSIAEAIR